MSNDDDSCRGAGVAEGAKDAAQTGWELVEGGADLAYRCAKNIMACSDNIVLALSPVIMIGAAVAFGSAAVLACATHPLACAIAVPVLGGSAVGSGYVAWELMNRLWFGDGDPYQPLGLSGPLGRLEFSYSGFLRSGSMGGDRFDC